MEYWRTPRDLPEGAKKLGKLPLPGRAYQGQLTAFPLVAPTLNALAINLGSNRVATAICGARRSMLASLPSAPEEVFMAKKPKDDQAKKANGDGPSAPPPGETPAGPTPSQSAATGAAVSARDPR